ncbi:MAG: tol-pal system protein YbgF [Pseudomonadota bacterium]
MQTHKLRLSLLGLGCALAFHAQAALFEDDEARRAILDLRQKVDAVQSRGSEEVRRAVEENGQLRRSVLELSSQIEMLRADLARMRGQEEQLARETSQLAKEVAEIQRRQKDLVSGVDDRFKRFEPIKVSVDGREFSADPAETRDFEAALALLRKGEFAPAEKTFVDFVRRYPASGYTPSALFWLGNAQYALRNYKDALVNFRSLVTSAPDHLRAPEAMLSVANCQLELKDPRAARKTLEDLVRLYPQAEAASVGKDRLARLK